MALWVMGDIEFVDGVIPRHCFKLFYGISLMSEQQLKIFLGQVKGDVDLRRKLDAAVDADAVVAIAKDAGFEITDCEFMKAQSVVSEQQLETVAGGAEYDPGDFYSKILLCP